MMVQKMKTNSHYLKKKLKLHLEYLFLKKLNLVFNKKIFLKYIPIY